MLAIKLVPLLRRQRFLYDMPRGWDRFQHYLRVMTGESHSSDIAYPPLVNFNPMGKQQASDCVDALMALDAERVAAQAIEAAAPRLLGVDADLRLGLVVADDAQGGWTSREFGELANQFPPRLETLRGWISVICWSSDIPTESSVATAVRSSLYRVSYLLKHGSCVNLRSMMAQEGQAAVFSGATRPHLDDEDVDYSRQVIRPYLDEGHPTVVLPCLYGDEAARKVGYDPLGLSPRAGYAVAVADALAEVSPQSAFSPH